MYRNCFWQSEQFLYTTCSPHVLQKEELLNKDLPVLWIVTVFLNQMFKKKLPVIIWPYFRFVGNLVVINLLSTILLIPLVCIDVTPPSLLLFGQYFNHPARCVVSKLASAWVSTSSVFGTLLIGVDQYLAIVYPLR